MNSGTLRIMNLPIVCTLTAAELRERRKTVLNGIRARAIDAAPITDGYAYRFAPSGEALNQLSQLISLERQCCRFLTFKMVVEAGEQPFQLEVTGPPEAQPIIKDLFGE